MRDPRGQFPPDEPVVAWGELERVTDRVLTLPPQDDKDQA